MSINKLSLTNKKVAFVTKGDFFCVITTLLTKEHSLIPVDSQIIRISRFNDEDFEDYIRETVDSDYIIFATNKFILGKTALEYIERPNRYLSENLNVLSEILGKDSFIIIRADFGRIQMIYKQSEKAVVRTASLKVKADTKADINQLLFDPQVGQKEEQFDKFTREQLLKWNKELDFSKVDYFVMLGEEIWSGHFGEILENLQWHTKDKAIYLIDEFGLIEAILSTDLASSKLAQLHKSIFQPQFGHLKDTRRKYIIYNQIQDQERKLFPDPNQGLSLNLGEEEIFESEEDFHNIKNVMIGQRIDKKNKLEFSRKSPKERSDHLFEMKNDHLKDEGYEHFRVGLKVPEGLQVKKIKFQVIHGEQVSEGQLLFSLPKSGGIFSQQVHSPAKGNVDLDYLDRGYVIVRNSRRKKRKQKVYSKYLKLRPRMIIGDSASGVLHEDIVFVQEFTFKGLDKGLLNNQKGLICQSISREDFHYLIERNWKGLFTIVVLEGIDVDFNDKFSLKHFDKFYTQIDSQKNNVLLGIETVSDVLSVSEKADNGVRVGDFVRVIEGSNWGNYAKIISVDGTQVVYETSDGFNTTSVLNIT